MNGFADTPAEGLVADDVPKIPLQASEVLELLKARLALDEDVSDAKLTLAAPYTTAGSSPNKWPDNAPSCSDITPSPVVIGLDEIAAMTEGRNDEAEIIGSEDDWREPAAKDTPAEPIASVRVRQASSPGNVNVNSTVRRVSDSNGDQQAAPDGPSSNERLYYPPMKPPEPSQRNRGDEPLVHVVPDCDAKTRTAPSLRRPSSRPAGPNRADVSGRRWVLAIAGACAAIAATVTIANRPVGTRAKSVAPASPPLVEDMPLLAPSVNAAPASNPSAIFTPDSGIQGQGTGGRTTSLGAGSMTLSGSTASQAGHLAPAKESKSKESTGQAKPSKAASNGNDGLVF